MLCTYSSDRTTKPFIRSRQGTSGLGEYPGSGDATAIASATTNHNIYLLRKRDGVLVSGLILRSVFMPCIASPLPCLFTTHPNNSQSAHCSACFAVYSNRSAHVCTCTVFRTLLLFIEDGPTTTLRTSCSFLLPRPIMSAGCFES